MTDRNAGRAYQKGAARPAAKLTDDDVIEIRKAVAHGSKQVDVAAEHGISQGLVSGIVNGHRWKHVDGPIRMTSNESEAE